MNSNTLRLVIRIEGWQVIYIYFNFKIKVTLPQATYRQFLYKDLGNKNIWVHCDICKNTTKLLYLQLIFQRNCISHNQNIQYLSPLFWKDHSVFWTNKVFPHSVTHPYVVVSHMCVSHTLHTTVIIDQEHWKGPCGSSVYIPRFTKQETKVRKTETHPQGVWAPHGCSFNNS